MEEKTQLLICLAAATAANCIPCFEYYFCEAKAAKLTREEIQQAVDFASTVKQGAFLALKNDINDIMGLKEQHELPCRGQSGGSCSG
jgi:alkylhydroperoxidase/carboxymuconolactone decarboxylase family protein YurZ